MANLSSARASAPVAVMLFASAVSALAGSFEHELAKQDPRTRALWVCERLGLERMKKDRALAKPDRVFLDVPAGSAKLVGGRLSGKGQVRDDRGWTEFTYSCTVSADHLKARTITYGLGPLTPWSKGHTKM